MSKPKVFVSHSSKDIEFAAKLVDDLNAAGAQAWLDSNDLGAGNFQARINQALADCEWFLLVLTPNALASPWVRQEVDAANRLRNQGKLQDLIFIKAAQVKHSEVPALWGVYNFFDATQKYQDALNRTYKALSISSVPADPPQTTPVVTAVSPHAVPPERFPPQLAELEYRVAFLKGAEVILPPMCDVPAGPFLMGSDPQRDKEAQPNEQPQHWVTLAAFQIGKYPVTVAEYACFLRATGRVVPPGEDGKPNQVSWATQVRHRLDHPVVMVNWRDAAAYAAWLATCTDQPWQLPSEAEWEKAARWDYATGKARIYPWGDAFDAEQCNSAEGNRGATTPVGNFPNGASPYGAHDMAGNVWEWTRSVIEMYPYEVSDGRERAESSQRRTLRGGSWHRYAGLMRAACRSGRNRDHAYDSRSFRVARAGPSS